MRVAQRMVSRNYRRTVNSALKKQADTLERSESGLKFKLLSDDVAAGSRAMHLQEERYQVNQQLENTKDLIAEMKSVDSNMDSIHSVLQKLQERILMGMSEDYGASAREVISKEVASKKEQLLQFVNNQFGGKYLFAGTNNSTQPFTEVDGKLSFNGIPVEQIWKSTTDGKYYYDKGLSLSEEGEWFKLVETTGNPPEMVEQYLSRVSTDDATGDVTYKNGAGNTFILRAADGKWLSGATKSELDPAMNKVSPVTMQEYNINGETVYLDTAAAGKEIYLNANNETLFVKENGVYTTITVNGTTLSDGAKDGTFYDGVTTYKMDADGVTFTNQADGSKVTITASTGVPTVVPNSGDTYADIGLGLRITDSVDADPRTAFQISFSGLTLTGFAGYDQVTPVIGANGTEVSGNVYDLLTQIENALSPDFDKKGLDDMFTQLVKLTDQVGMTRTDLGNRMEYLELTEARLEDDIDDMTALETELISSDPAQEAIKMKECEYVWLAVMQLGSKILPASLLDFMS